MAKIPGLPVAFIALGGVLVWSGVENEPVTAVLRSLASGKAPAKGGPETFATPGTSTIGTSSTVPGAVIGGGSATGVAIANAAVQYAGHCYAYGGAPGTDGKSCWDCSSFVNWVVGHDLGMAIPGIAGGTYTGASHGPPTGAWLLWTGATTIGHSSGVAQAGDILVYQTHMGICTGPNQMISAEKPSQGTAESGIDGMTQSLHELLFVRRLKAELAGTGVSGPGPRAKAGA